MKLEGLIVYGGYAGIILDKIEQEVKGQTTSVTMYLINRILSYESENEGEGWMETKHQFDVVNPKLLKRFLTDEEQDGIGVLKEIL